MSHDGSIRALGVHYELILRGRQRVVGSILVSKFAGLLSFPRH